MDVDTTVTSLEAAVLAMAVPTGVGAPENPSVEAHFAALLDAVGPHLVLSVAPELVAPEPEPFCQRVMVPLVGAIRMLADRPGHQELLTSELRRVEIRSAATAADRSIAVADGHLQLVVRPDVGAAGTFTAQELIDALDDGLGLAVRADVAEREASEREFWQRLLREALGRDVPLLVDWDAFLTHAEHGHDRLVPYHVDEAGVRRLVYALKGWTDDDEEFRTLARARITGLEVTCAATPDDVGLTARGGVIVSACHPGPSLRGFPGIDALQQALWTLLPTLPAAPAKPA